jgi:hypothetical protein
MRIKMPQRTATSHSITQRTAQRAKQALQQYFGA